MLFILDGSGFITPHDIFDSLGLRHCLLHIHQLTIHHNLEVVHIGYLKVGMEIQGLSIGSFKSL